jgi:RHS repeat-associated protein
MLVPNRHGSTPAYRYGFQGQEKDDELKGEGNSLNYAFRMHDPRVGRFFATDPLEKKYTWYSPYAFSGNRVIDSKEIEGLEPRVTITDKISGYTFVKVPGAGNIDRFIIPTYHAKVEYVKKDGSVELIGEYNITRDGWYNMGTDANGDHILHNRSSDPSPSNQKIFIESKTPEKYGEGTPVFNLSPIESPLDPEYNKTHFENGKPGSPLGSNVKRNNGTAQNSQIHVSGIYVKKDFLKLVIAGTYGCYGIVAPEQVYTVPDPIFDSSKQPSNDEMTRFGTDIQTSIDMYLEERNIKDDKVEVNIMPREYEKLKTVTK